MKYEFGPNEAWSEEKDPRTFRADDALPESGPTCIAPWTTICLSANGNIKPCCVYTTENDKFHFNFLGEFILNGFH